MRAEKFILRHWSISVILRIRSWNLNIRNTKEGSYSEVTLWKMIPGLMQYSPSKDHQHLKWRPQKSWMSLWRKSSWRNIGVHPCENGGCSKTTQNSKIRMSICVDTSSKTWMAQILVEHWRSRVRVHRWPCSLQFFGSSTDQASTFFALGDSSSEILVVSSFRSFLVVPKKLWEYIEDSGPVRHGTVKSWKQWWRGVKIRDFDFETLTLGMGQLNQEPWYRVERDWSALKEEKVSVTSGKKKVSVRKETDEVSATKPKIVRKKQNTLPAANRITRSKCVEEEKYPKQK